MQGKLFCGVMYPTLGLYQEAIDELTKRYGKIEVEGEEYDFGFTDYYDDEFGTGLKKRFVVFRTPVERETLPVIKLFTCELERKLGGDVKRTVNIDPGYITQNNVVVASTKEFPSRIYLGKGIYGDLQLILKRNEAMLMPFTFADYKLNKGFFLKMRQLAPKQIR